jgi:hypothetical protein
MGNQSLLQLEELLSELLEPLSLQLDDESPQELAAPPPPKSPPPPLTKRSGSGSLWCEVSPYIDIGMSLDE